MSQIAGSALLANCKALMLAIIFAVGLVTIVELVWAWAKEFAYGPDLILSPWDTAALSAVFSAEAALLIAATSVPIWWLAGKVGARTYQTAALLGFLMTMAAWILLFNWGGRGVWPRFEFEIMGTGLRFALIGALAGMVCWRFSPARRAQ